MKLNGILIYFIELYDNLNNVNPILNKDITLFLVPSLNFL